MVSRTDQYRPLRLLIGSTKPLKRGGVVAVQFQTLNISEHERMNIDTPSDDEAARIHLVAGVRHEKPEDWHAAETTYPQSVARSSPDPRVRKSLVKVRPEQ